MQKGKSKMGEDHVVTAWIIYGTNMITELQTPLEPGQQQRQKTTEEPTGLRGCEWVEAYGMKENILVGC